MTVKAVALLRRASSCLQEAAVEEGPETGSFPVTNMAIQRKRKPEHQVDKFKKYSKRWRNTKLINLRSIPNDGGSKRQ